MLLWGQAVASESGEHTEGHSGIEMDNKDISVQPAGDAVRYQSVFQGSSVIKL